jgi:hypothetical protein
MAQPCWIGAAASFQFQVSGKTVTIGSLGGSREKRGERQVMRFLRHLGRLLKEFLGFAWHHKAWWIVPVVLVLLLVALLIVTGQTAAPFIYTLF